MTTAVRPKKPIYTVYPDGRTELARCVYCGEPADVLDHVVPRSRGGTDDPENLVAACNGCNGDKGVNYVGDFASGQRIGARALISRPLDRMVGLVMLMSGTVHKTNCHFIKRGSAVYKGIAPEILESEAWELVKHRKLTGCRVCFPAVPE
jgi:hypothetical protein